MKTITTITTIGLAALLISTANAATLVKNVAGYNVDPTGKLHTFNALLVDDAGKVAATGEEALKAKADTVIDGKGSVMLPGLIDAHGHVINGLARALITVDLADTKSLAEAQQRIRDFAAKYPDAPWVIGRGWNQVTWNLGRFPTAAELDAAVSDRPVFMARVDGHAGWANSKAVALSGVTAATVDPVGGRVIKDDKGKPTGIFVDGAQDFVESKIPPFTHAQYTAALKNAMSYMNSLGLTGVHDAGVEPWEWTLYKEFAEKGDLSVRIYAMIGGMKVFDEMSKDGPLSGLYNDRLWLRSIKLYADGALGSRGAALKAPYADEPGNKGLMFRTQEQMDGDVIKAASKGFQVNIHAIGDAANLQVIDSYAKAPREGLRHRIEHAQIMTPEDIVKAAKLGLIGSMQPTHATSDRVMAEQRLGHDRLHGAYAWRSWLNAGGRIALGSDFPVEYVNPFFGLHAAVTRQGQDNQPEGGWFKDEALNMTETLYGFTQAAAYAGFQEKTLGGLDKGKWADFILIDRDVFKIDPKEVWKTKVKQTWVAGKRVWCASGECSQ